LDELRELLRSGELAPSDVEDVMAEFYALPHSSIPKSLKAELAAGVSQWRWHAQAAADTADIPHWRHFVGTEGCARHQRVHILSYNVLAAMYAAKHDANCPLDKLDWSVRKWRLLQEIVHYDADVICLQEVQHLHYVEDFAPYLHERGYRSLYCLRTPWVVSQGKAYQEEGKAEDGIALFWRYATLDLHDHAMTLYSDLLSGASSAYMQASKTHVGNVAAEKGAIIVAMLHHRASGQCLIVGNTHLFHNPAHADIKSSQALMFVNYVHNFEHRLRSQVHPDVSIILCGDFNSQPELAHSDIAFNPNEVSLTFRGGEQSGVYTLLTTGKLETDHMHHPASWNPAKNAGMEEMETNSRYNFSSAYKTWMGQEPDFTTVTPKFCATIDYLWLSRSAVGKLCGVLSGVPVHNKDEFSQQYLEGKVRGIASYEDATATVEDASRFPKNGIPTTNEYPSDHIAVGCAVRLY